MHNEGKKHKRTVALKELTQGHLQQPQADSAPDVDIPPGHAALPTSPLQQQQDGMIEGADHPIEALFCSVCQVAVPSQEHLQYHLAYVL